MEWFCYVDYWVAQMLCRDDEKPRRGSPLRMSALRINSDHSRNYIIPIECKEYRNDLHGVNRLQYIVRDRG